MINRLAITSLREEPPSAMDDQHKANEIRKSIGLPKQPDNGESTENNAENSTENNEEQKYQEIADSFPLDEQHPPMPENFTQPVIGNMFGDNDRATLAGKAIAKVYDNLVNREVKTGAYSAEQIIQMGNEELNDFKDYANESGISFSTTRKPGETGFHLNGESGRSSRDHLFYFNKSTREWKNPNEQQVRAYLTLGPSEIKNVQEHFVDLCQELNNEGIDFMAKAASPNGFDRRTDNLVFYIAGQDQAKASQLIKDFMKDRGIGKGNVSAAIPSPDQPGLSWAMEVTEDQNSIWQKVSGSSERCSYNSYVATRAIPYYLRRISEAHSKLGDLNTAKVFEDEARRVEGITK